MRPMGGVRTRIVSDQEVAVAHGVAAQEGAWAVALASTAPSDLQRDCLAGVISRPDRETCGCPRGRAGGSLGGPEWSEHLAGPRVERTSCWEAVLRGGQRAGAWDGAAALAARCLGGGPCRQAGWEIPSVGIALF
jgi:hypothetical protein